VTVARCQRCGEEKFGAWVPCAKCGFEPATPEDRAKAVLLSDHHVRGPALAELGRRIAAGELISFDERQVAQLAAGFTNLPPGGPLGCRVAVALLLLALFATLGLLVWPWLAR
jgi:hypothetical protein